MSATAHSVSYPRSGTRGRALQLDTLLVLAVAGILLVSAVMVASSSISIAARETGDSFYFFKRQLVFIVLGVLACGATTRVPSAWWEKLQFPLLLLAFALLIAVLIPGLGVAVNGGRRWINLGFTRFQPSELARIFIL
ncbi:MAG: FtsW/RodA/SpoVE family cell cycle protein, partial [Steroidobacteraceae bacterium]